MELKDQKILNLIESKDDDTKNLGELTLENYLAEDNVIFWYITIDVNKAGNSLRAKFTEMLGWNAKKTPLESLKSMLEIIMRGNTNAASVNAYFEFYNKYLYHVMSATWTKEQKSKMKNQINVFINVSHSTTKSN